MVPSPPVGLAGRREAGDERLDAFHARHVVDPRHVRHRNRLPRSRSAHRLNRPNIGVGVIGGDRCDFEQARSSPHCSASARRRSRPRVRRKRTASVRARVFEGRSSP